jgi:hypothetical protein
MESVCWTSPVIVGRPRLCPLGMEPTRSMARDPSSAPDRCAAVRDPRTDRRSALGSLCRAQAAAPAGSSKPSMDGRRR